MNKQTHLVVRPASTTHDLMPWVTSKIVDDPKARCLFPGIVVGVPEEAMAGVALCITYVAVRATVFTFSVPRDVPGMMVKAPHL